MKKQIQSMITIVFGVAFSLHTYAVDQCNTTMECKVEFGDHATDCANSRSDASICMCGTERCDANEPGVPGINVPGLIQAEDYDRYADGTAGNAGNSYRNDDVDIQVTTDAGAGFNVGWTQANEWLEYDIVVDRTASYQLSARVASQPGGGMFTVWVDGTQRGAAVNVPPTGGWQAWRTLVLDLGSLPAGDHSLRVQVLAGGFNLNWYNIEQQGTQDNWLGRFNLNSDLLMAHFDSRPDPDDIHSVAGLATMLKDPRFSAVNYHAISGAYGIQGGDYIEAAHLFNLAFGASHWSNAHTQRNAALNQAYAKVSATLAAGGDVWVQEAGQSDFTADWVRRVRQNMPGIDTTTRIHVVQHSQWNEDKTTAADLNYVRTYTDYVKIDDGNSTQNATPGFNTKSGSNWSRALSDPEVGAIWQEAKRVADNAIANHQGWANPSIRDGGMDFSDVVEDCWIFGFEDSLNNTNSFFDEFL